MNLEIAKVVAFAICTEYGEGVMGKSPEEILDHLAHLQVCKTMEEIREYVGGAAVHMLNNYINVWAPALDAAAPPRGKERVEITEKGLAELEAAEKPSPPEAEAPPPKKKRGKGG